MKNIWIKPLMFVTAAAVAVTFSNAASAAFYSYTQTNGDVLTIDTETNTGTLKGANIDTTFTSEGFASFNGGADSAGQMFVLTSLEGTRIIGGNSYFDNPSHTQKLLFQDNGRVNLWSWWGNPIAGGDYITHVDSYTVPAAVPAPGILGLFGLGLAGLAFSRRLKSVKTNHVETE